MLILVMRTHLLRMYYEIHALLRVYVLLCIYNTINKFDHRNYLHVWIFTFSTFSDVGFKESLLALFYTSKICMNFQKNWFFAFNL